MEFKTTELSPFGVSVEPIEPQAHISGLDVDMLRELFHQHHLVVLRGFSTFETADEFADYCENLGEIGLWPFGKVLELVEQEKPEDHVFANNYVPMHWDGMFRPQVPEYQIFHCVTAPGGDQGGRTTFSNTALVVERATPEQLELWAKVNGHYNRKMEYYDSKTVAPILTKHPVSEQPIIRYCEPPNEGDDGFVNRPDYTYQGIPESDVKEFRQGLEEALYAPENFLAHSWQSGDIVLSDNYTLLHGREEFTSGAGRHLRRVHVLGTPALDNPHLLSHA